MNRRIGYSNFYKFKARIIYIPSSHNVLGSDPIPAYHKRTSELMEVLAYSDKVKSIDDGYKKDDLSGLWVKNLENPDIDDLIGQFEMFSMEPPYWYYDAQSYSNWWNMTMDNQTLLKSEYMNSPATQVKVDNDSDEMIPIVHYYKEVVNWTTRQFYKNKVVSWPKLKGVKIYNKNFVPSVTETTNTTNETNQTSGTSGGY